MHPLSRRKCQPKVGQHFVADGTEYELAGAIGDGAVGLVRKARVVGSDELVAVKFLAPDPKYIEPRAFDDVSERFRREGQRGVGLRHDNLVKVRAYEDNVRGIAFEKRQIRNPFLVMEYVRGTTVESLIKNLARLNNRAHVTIQTLTIGLSVSKALLHLHERKLIHRDVKPANIFVSTSVPGSTPAEIKLGDFGVTKWGDFLAATTTGTLTMSHQQGLGTLKYMSPEQATRPKDVTVRSDMFSFGITLFELFSGRILQSPHHVFEIMTTRDSRSSLTGKLHTLGLTRLTALEESAFEPVLDMFLAASGRPTSKQMVGRLGFMVQQLVERQSSDY